MKRESLDLSSTIAAELRTRIKSGSVLSNGCWLWGKHRKRVDWYGQISIHDTPTPVHRVAYEVFRGPILDGLEVCHTCDVKQCCNPEHLFLGTHLENIHDALAKGRLQAPPVHFGERHPMATLTDEQVEELRTLQAAGFTQRELARRFNVSQSTVWRLVHRLWRTS